MHLGASASNSREGTRNLYQILFSVDFVKCTFILVTILYQYISSLRFIPKSMYKHALVLGEKLHHQSHIQFFHRNVFESLKNLRLLIKSQKSKSGKVRRL